MSEYDDIVYGGQNPPEDDDEFWETVYPEGYEEIGLTGGKAHEEEKYSADDDADKMERLMWVSDVLNDGSVHGEGTGVEVTGVVAALLDNKEKYGFEFRFFRVDDETPWDGGEKSA